MKTLVRLSLFFIALTALLRAQESKDVQWSFALARPAVVGEEVEVVITARIAPEWIVYSSDFKADLGPQATRIIFEASEAFRLVGELVSVAPKRKTDKTWETEFGYFETRAEFRQKIKVLQAAPVIVGRIKGQLCNERDGTCTLFEQAFKL